MQIDRLHLDTVIFGGGVAGLWLLDALSRSGRRAVLLEADTLGAGQTIASQGIIHGGLKYTLRGAFTESARAIAQMPELWRSCLRGEARPDLSATRVRAEYCHVWRTESVSSRLAMIGARAGLRVAPVNVDHDDRPEPLVDCPGSVARLDEQVVDPASLLANLANRHSALIWKIDAEHGLNFAHTSEAHTPITVQITSPASSRLELATSSIILAAGAGNAELRAKLDLPVSVMQRRALHMVMARGPLPILNGHCVDGRATRLTITTHTAPGCQNVWQIGGQIAEQGVAMQRDELIDHAINELRATLPGIDLSNVELSTYRVDRAERATHGKRPEDASVICDGPIITCWPTKLALAPHLAELVMRALPEPRREKMDDPIDVHWPAPSVASPPWETEPQWIAAH